MTEHEGRRTLAVRAVVASAVVFCAGGLAWQAQADPASPSTAAALPSHGLRWSALTDAAVGAPAAWARGARGQGVDVALLDTGVTPVQGLDAADKLVQGPDLSFDSQDPARAHLDGYGHGTAMAGIIAGNDGTPDGYTGVAPDARVVSVKVGASTGATDVSQVIAGIDWVVEHAQDPGFNIRVLNVSLGTDSSQAYQLDPLAHAAEVAWRHGIVVVVAVGNDGRSTRLVADPASDPYLLDVGAENTHDSVSADDDTVAGFSQRGTGKRHADLVAPGVNVTGLLSPGSVLATQYPDAVKDGRFLRGSGTSQAAAVTSGVVADLLSARPYLTPDQVKQLLTSTADDIRTQNPVAVGSGLVQVDDALRTATPRARRSDQSFEQSTGTGSLEAARGSSHVSIDGVPLVGEQDVFGQPWTDDSAAVEDDLTAWVDGLWNGSTWSGSTWSGSTWSGSTWSGSTWSGSTWSGSTWSGSTWSGSTWSGSTWSGSTWSGSTWSGSTWSGDSWLGATWG